RSRLYKPGAGLQPRGNASPAARPSPPAPRCRRPSTCKDVSRAELLRPAFFPSPARGNARCKTGGGPTQTADPPPMLSRLSYLYRRRPRRKLAPCVLHFTVSSCRFRTHVPTVVLAAPISRPEPPCFASPTRGKFAPALGSGAGDERMDLSPPFSTIHEGSTTMAATETTERRRMQMPSREAHRTPDETKHALKTTEFFAMVGVIGAILIASAVSDSLGDVRAWTLVAAVAIGYMISRGLAKSGTKYVGGEDTLTRNN